MNFTDYFIHEQVTPSTEWTVVHDLNRYVVSDVFFDEGLDGTLEKVLPASVRYIDANTLKIFFTEPQIGKVKVG
jgi:hypothetical protein